MNSRIKLLVFALVVVFCTGCDRVTKIVAHNQLADRGAITYLHDTFRLQYAENTGAAMSLGDDLPQKTSFWALGIAPLIFLIVLLAYSLWNYRKLALWEMAALALIFAGGISNVFDRLYYDRHVIDFMNVGIGSLRSGIFNFADFFLCIGVVWILLYYFVHLFKGDKQHATE